MEQCGEQQSVVILSMKEKAAEMLRPHQGSALRLFQNNLLFLGPDRPTILIDRLE